MFLGVSLNEKINFEKFLFANENLKAPLPYP